MTQILLQLSNYGVGKMKKISSKIILALGLMVSFICFGLGLTAYLVSKKSLVGVLKETMPKVAIEASITIEDGIQNQLNTLNILASLDSIEEVLSSSDADYKEVMKILSDEVKRAGHKQMILVDRTGKAIFDDGSVADLSNNSIFKDALSGNEFATEPALDGTGTGIIMIYAVPVKMDGQIAGVLMAVRDGLELSDFAGKIKFGETGEVFIINSQGRTIAHSNKALLMDIIKTASGTSSGKAKPSDINMVDMVSSATEKADTVSSATAKSDGASRLNESGEVAKQLGFEGFSDVQRQMTEGRMGFGEYNFHGVAKVAGYAPFDKYAWSIAVTVDQDEMLSGLKELRITFFIASIIFLIGGFLVALIIGKSISRPITYLSNECNVMSSGDFSRVMDKKYAKRQDEIGLLARAFDNINIKVSQIIRNVIEKANGVGNAIKNIDENMYTLTSEIKAMSGIIDNLSLKMDENSSAAEEMASTSNEIEGAIDFIAGETQQNAETAGEVSKRAGKLKDTAIDSQKQAQDILMDVAVRLREAIEKSKAVERIQVLSDAILAISSKTNLLALNAAIEASHSGNASSGFTVVADEIKKLAEKSKQTVNEIKDVTSAIIESVHILSDNAEQVLKFIEDKVVKDYDMLVETGEQYDRDAGLLNDMVSNLSATAEELYASIQTMSQAIEYVAAASEEGAAETMQLASEAAEVVKRTNEVLIKTNDVNKSAERLLKLVSIFKV